MAAKEKYSSESHPMGAESVNSPLTIPPLSHSEDGPDQDLFDPIGGGNGPTGLDLRYDDRYDAIKKERFEDDPTLPQGVWQRDLKKADWVAVEKQCREALKHHTKDLQIAAWMTEALMHLHGIPGMTRGLRVMERLSATFWETIHPQIRAGDVEFRLAPFEWVNEKISPLLRSTAVTLMAGPAGSEKKIRYTYGDLQEAKILQNRSKMGKTGASTLKQAEQEGHITLARFQGAMNETPTAFYEQLRQEMAEALKAVQDLEDFVFDRCPGYGGILHKLRKDVHDLNHFVSSVLEKRGTVQSNQNTDLLASDKQSGSPQKPVVQQQGMRGDRFTSRDEAYEQLGVIADYLSNIEPHSPTPYLIRRAMTWGRMPLSELLEEIVHDRGDLNRIFQLLGMPPQSAHGSGLASHGTHGGSVASPPQSQGLKPPPLNTGNGPVPKDTAPSDKN